MSQPPPYSPQDPTLGYVPPGAAPTDSIGFATLPTQVPQTNIYFSPNSLPGNTITILPEVIVTTLGPNPQRFTCPFCYHVSTTKVETTSSTKTHLFAIFMFFFCAGHVVFYHIAWILAKTRTIIVVIAVHLWGHSVLKDGSTRFYFLIVIKR